MSASVPTVTPTPLGILRHYQRVAGVRWWHFAIPIALILFSTALDGASLSLLIPLTDAISENSFALLEDSRWVGWIPGLVEPFPRQSVFWSTRKTELDGPGSLV